MRHLLLVLSLLVAVGCGNRNDSVVVVTLTSASPVEVASVRSQAVAGGLTRSFTLSPRSAGRRPR